ncbi:MAG: Gfo/Idh/MocA family oxidoreductase [bacterium]|jgi:predicted dehydrogenase|nr:Gfo/Idh/MocA family oxidoreductase [bacterium]
MMGQKWMCKSVGCFCLILVMALSSFGQTVPAVTPVRVAIAGMVHGHVHGFLSQARDVREIEIVGLYDPDQALGESIAKRFGYPSALIYTDLAAMLDEVKPQAVATFTSTFDHLAVIQACAARGIDVMVEKPLAVDTQQADAIAATAQEGGIAVIVNYETTWYPSNHYVYDVVKEKQIGDIRKIVVHDGHQGPKEIGCSQEFLDWLTDPVLNGAGALFDFGCYGANLMTWLMDNQRPLTVTAVTQQIKPDVYPHVDDEATILLTYPNAQGIIQASWNWPFNRKDMEVYGRTGYVHQDTPSQVRKRLANQAEETIQPEPLPAPHQHSLAYLAAVVRGEIEPEGLSSLENNRIVTEILEAARLSVQTGKTVILPN